MDCPLVKQQQQKTFFTLQCTEVICVTDKSYKNSFEIYVASLSKKDSVKKQEHITYRTDTELIVSNQGV